MSILRRLILILALCFMPCLVYAQNIGVMMQEADGNPASTYTYKLILPNGSITSITSSVATLNFLTPTGDGSGLSGVVTTETDPIVAAITGVICANGSTIAACTNLTDAAVVFVEQANCAMITSGCCKDTDNGYVYCWDGDSVEEVARPGSVTSIADPNADRIYFWDDDPGNPALLAPDDSTIEINATTLRVKDAGITAAKLATAANAIVTASKSSAYTIGTDNAKEAYGGVIYVTSAAVITAPAVAAGMSFSVITIGAIAVSLDVNASDKMYLDGVLLDDGDKATNTSTTGDMITCTYFSADGWYCASGSPDGDHWTDGGA